MPRTKLALARLAFVLLLLAIWELAARTIVNPFWIGEPIPIFRSLILGLADGELIVHAFRTFIEAMIGLAVGAAIGVPMGIALYRYRTFAQIVDPVFMGLYSLPRVALAPLFILWFGIDLFSKVALVASLVVFVFAFNTLEGLKGVDGDLRDALVTMRASPTYIMRRLMLPAIVPWLITALRLGIGLALVGAVIGEMIGASSGLGWHLNAAAAQLDTTDVFADLILLMIVATALNNLLVRMENHMLFWRVG